MNKMKNLSKLIQSSCLESIFCMNINANRIKRALCSKKFLCLQGLMIFLWGAQLLNSDAYYVNYLLVIIISLLCCFWNIMSKNNILLKKHDCYLDKIIIVFSILFSLMITFSNYKILLSGSLATILKFAFFLVAAFFAFWNLFSNLASNIERFTWNRYEDFKYSPKRVFFTVFLIIVLSRVILLYFFQFPGVLTADSLDQISQILYGNYSNHHPFYHTQIIRCFMLLGMDLFGDINAGVATYSLFQILFTAICFSLTVSTMVEMKVSRWIVLSSILFFLFMPYHIIYSITMWKDVMFGCLILIWIVFFYRCIKNINNSAFNYTWLALLSLGICLLRSNGLFAFLILTLAYLVLWKNKNKKLLFIFCSVIILSIFMKYSVLKQLNVRQPDTIEALSIPAQQIARVVQEGHALNNSEKKLLGEVIEVKKIPKAYKPWLSDPIKNLVRKRNNQKMLSGRKWDFVKLYFSLGCRYPKTYIYAWIDQTRGYWNAGYSYWRWTFQVDKNRFGIAKKIRSESVGKIITGYFECFTKIQGLKLFVSIGLFIWIDIIMLFIALIRKDKIGAYVSMPILCIVTSLLVATPVFAEFRYIYAAFCSLPIVMVIVLRPIDKHGEISKNDTAKPNYT